MIFLIYKIILEIYKNDGGKNFETSNFYKNRLKTRVLRKNNHKKWIVDFVDSSSRGDLHNKLTQFSITGQLLWKMSSSSCLWAKFGATRKQLSIFFLTVSSRGGWLAQQTSPSPRSLEFIMKKESSPCSLRPRGLLRAYMDFMHIKFLKLKKLVFDTFFWKSY